ncbi:MAG: hypothetical protein O9310_08935 [Leptospiraceae bacterium]|nr:hypothetical protein [Leptospiraceae bacterium]
MSFSSPNNLFPILTIVNIFFILHCSFIKPSDPNFRAKAFYNEQYSGFISDDFFQIRVVTNLTVKEIPVLEKRKDCKRRSYAIRNELTVPILINELKEIENDRFKGINRIRKSYSPVVKSANNQSTNFNALTLPPEAPVPYPLVPLSEAQKNRPQQNTPGIANTQNNPNLPSNSANNNGNEIKSENLFKPKMEYLQAEFSWLLDSLILYKEDYSEKEKCIFIYRAAKKGLYEKLEQTKLSVDWEQSP